MSKLYTTLVLVTSCFFLFAQEEGEEEKIDSLSTNIIQSVYNDNPDAVSNVDSTAKKSSSFNVYPYVFYTPETKFAGGAGGMFIFYTGKSPELNPSKIGFGGYYSTNNQYKISMNNIYYFWDNKLYFHLPISYGYFINKYWGIGNETPDYEDAGYAVQTLAATLTVQVPPEWFFADRTGLIIDYDYTEIKDVLNNELLIDNDSLAGAEGGHLIGLGSDLLWDSRDNIFYPTTGGYQYFRITFYPGMSDYVFTMLELDVRHYRSLWKDAVLAGNFYLESATGETPFYKLPGIGGKQMRGFFYGRYRDNFYAMMQLEYRQFFAKRWGFVVFGTLGNVSENIIDYTLVGLKYSYGAGIRFKFNQKENVNLRADIGIGADGNSGIYFGIEEAF